MVFTTLDLVLGFTTSKEELIKLLNLPQGAELDEYFLTDILQNLFKDRSGGRSQIAVHQFVCCSKSQGEIYVVGFPLHKYYRQVTHCEKCPGPRTVCDDCIGMTNNGHYDIQDIADGPVKGNIRHICLNCFHDNKRDLMSPQETCKIVENRYVPDSNVYDEKSRLKCTVCGILPSEFLKPEDHLEKFVGQYSSVKKILTKCGLRKDIAFYYIIDDCLSCT